VADKPDKADKAKAGEANEAKANKANEAMNNALVGEKIGGWYSVLKARC
jgi:hypothetical protein